MRLLHTTELRLVADSDTAFRADPRYAILSHRWMDDEISFEDLFRLDNPEDKSLAMKKVKGACNRAREDGYTWIWIDSLCICKTNAVELGEAINSMFRWYRKADICYAYLSDVVLSNDHPTDTSIFTRCRDAAEKDGRLGKSSEWFSRGWTLQELLAPTKMQFFDRDWNLIGTRQQLAKIIAELTKIDARYLTGESNFRDACIAVKMSWAAERKTTKVEDRTYSLLGIFDIPMDVKYGEGSRAFVRLEKELLATYVDESLFAWTTPSAGLPSHRDCGTRLGKDEWGLIAPSPECFAGMQNIEIKREKSPGKYPYISAEGVCMESIYKRAAVSYGFVKSRFGKIAYHVVLFPLWGFYTSILLCAVADHYVISLHCFRNTAAGLKPILIHIRKPEIGSGPWRRARCSVLETELLSIGGARWWYNQRMEAGFTILQPEPEEQ